MHGYKTPRSLGCPQFSTILLHRVTFVQMLPNPSSINMPKKIEADNEGSIEAIRLSSSEPSPLQEPHPLVDEGKLLRKIDLHVLPILFIVYVAAFIDRRVLSM